jgi:hypothetical protein
MLLLTSVTSVISLEVLVFLWALFLGIRISMYQKVGDGWFSGLVFLTSRISEGIETEKNTLFF